MSQYETRALDELTPYDHNPRVNDKAVEHVAESIRKHGQVNPIIISKAGHPFGQEVICCGHTRLLALAKLGAKEARVVVHEFKDEAEFVDLNIRDNKTSEFAEWDEAILGQLSSQFDIDLKEMDFDFTENHEPEDFSEKNEEIDMDDLDDSCELKLKYDAEVYEAVLDALREHDDDLPKALLKALDLA